MKRSFLSPECLVLVGLWLIIGGLAGEAALIVEGMLFEIISSKLEKSLTILFTVAIALGVWLEHAAASIVERSKERDAEIQIAEASARASEAQLELQKFKAPRQLTPEQAARMIDELKIFPGTPFDVSAFGDPEAISLARYLGSLFVSAGWDWKFADELVSVPVIQSGDVPNIGSTLGSGLYAVVNFSKKEEWRPQVVALMRSLDTIAGLEMKAISTTAHEPPFPTSNAIHIIVGKKK